MAADSRSVTERCHALRILHSAVVNSGVRNAARDAVVAEEAAMASVLKADLCLFGLERREEGRNAQPQLLHTHTVNP